MSGAQPPAVPLFPRVLRKPYRPGEALVGEPTPQTDPDLFTKDEIMAEVRYLMRLNKRLGSHPLRTAAYMRLLKIAESR